MPIYLCNESWWLTFASVLLDFGDLKPTFGFKRGQLLKDFSDLVTKGLFWFFFLNNFLLKA
jgi:hypothetical protein